MREVFRDEAFNDYCCFDEKTLSQCFKEWNAITDKRFDFGTFVDWLKKDGWRII